MTNNGGSTGYTFTGNSSFTFEFTDAYGNTGSETAIVARINKGTITGSVTYSPSTPTSGNVIATVNFNTGGITISNNGGSTGYLFTGNSSFTFEFQDGAGNTGSETATVNWIDKAAPLCTIIYNQTFSTPNPVTATLNCNETTIVTNNAGNPIHTFTGNGNFTFEFMDTLGNTGNQTATVSRISAGTPPPAGGPSGG